MPALLEFDIERPTVRRTACAHMAAYLAAHCWSPSMKTSSQHISNLPWNSASKPWTMDPDDRDSDEGFIGTPCTMARLNRAPRTGRIHPVMISSVSKSSRELIRDHHFANLGWIWRTVVFMTASFAAVLLGLPLVG